MPRPEFTANELRILWYLKRNNPLRAKDASPRSSLTNVIGGQLNIRPHTVGHVLRALEERSLILRTYKRDIRATFGDRTGFNPIMMIELVDPDMWLPPLPPPLPLAVVVADENRELEERVLARTERKPTAEAIVEALLNRITEQQQQIDDLIGRLNQAHNELDRRKQQERREREVPEHLMGRVSDALPADVWQRLTHEK